MLLDYAKKIPREFLEEVERAWGLGRVNVSRVKYSEMDYVFKYVSKSLNEAPNWLLDKLGRTRFFQTSRGFFVTESRPSMKREKTKSMVRRSLRQLMHWDAKRALVTFDDETGQKRVRKVRLSMPFAEWFQRRLQIAMTGRVPIAGPSSFSICDQQLASLLYVNRNSCLGLACIS